MLGLDDIDLYYESYGNGSAILGIHGTPSSALLWQDAARELSLRGRCVIYDRRGFGRSGRPQPFYSMDLREHVEDAAALLDALCASPAVVIGRSTGGLIALELAHRHPQKVQALVLLEPALFSVDNDAAAWAKRLRDTVLQVAGHQPGLAAELIIREALGDQGWDSLPQDLRDVFVSAGPAVLAETRGRGLDLSEEALELTQRDLAVMAQPTLLVSAEDSPEVLRRINDRLAEALPQAEKVLVTGGHLINPADTAVLDFLARTFRPPRPPR
jgi:pimeloyl-ACP methyl ester carboxylesterase